MNTVSRDTSGFSMLEVTLALAIGMIGVLGSMSATHYTQALWSSNQRRVDLDVLRQNLTQSLKRAACGNAMINMEGSPLLRWSTGAERAQILRFELAGRSIAWKKMALSQNLAIDEFWLVPKLLHPSQSGTRRAEMILAAVPQVASSHHFGQIGAPLKLEIPFEMQVRESDGQILSCGLDDIGNERDIATVEHRVFTRIWACGLLAL